MKTEFFPMQKLPEVSKDFLGNIEPFTESVLVFDEKDPSFCEIGWYNFDVGMWQHDGDFSMKLICWCNIPDATQFTKYNSLIPVLHQGYTEK